MQSELKPCAHETQCAKHTDTSRSDHPVKRMLDFATNRVETQAAEITRLTEALRAAEEREKALREALGATEGAIAEYYRYWTGGEMRGSYDGKPERNGLWQALHKAHQALAGAKP